MSAKDEFLRLDNLQRAWRWIRSNADAMYKSYFRDLYSVYAIADDPLLIKLSTGKKGTLPFYARAVPFAIYRVGYAVYPTARRSLSPVCLLVLTTAHQSV